jgi:hypothetical protein
MIPDRQQWAGAIAIIGALFGLVIFSCVLAEAAEARDRDPLINLLRGDHRENSWDLSETDFYAHSDPSDEDRASDDDESVTVTKARLRSKIKRTVHRDLTRYEKTDQCNILHAAYVSRHFGDRPASLSGLTGCRLWRADADYHAPTSDALNPPSLVASVSIAVAENVPVR